MRKNFMKNAAIQWSSDAEVIIYRKKSELLSGLAFKIYADGKRVCTIDSGEAHRLFLLPGTHSIYAKIGKLQSEACVLNINAGQSVFLECGFNGTEFNKEDIFELLKAKKKGIYLRENKGPDESIEIQELLSKTEKRKPRKYFLLALSKICLIMCIIGAFGFFNGFLTAWGKAFWITSKTPLPMGDPAGIAVDNKGNIYVALGFYYRIQKYSPEGMFLKGWPSNDNNPRIQISADDQLEVASYHKNSPDTLRSFDSEGNITSQKVIDGCYAEFGKDTERFCRDKNGNTYSIHNRYWWPYIMKVTPSGVKAKVVIVPWYLWLIQGPFPAWLMFAVGLAGLAKLRDYALRI
jgi:hypothetical protein